MRAWVVLLVTALLLTGCSSGATKRPTSVSAAPTPIERLNTGSMTLARVRFCSLVPRAAVREALAGASARRASWRNGDRAGVETGLDDVVREDGCRWSRGDTSASAWLFAGSVTSAEAQRFVADATRRTGCRAAVTSFGTPGVRQACRLPDGSRRVRVAGLFDDTWLSCEVAAPVSTPAKEVRGRADAWCVEVANALNTTR